MLTLRRFFASHEPLYALTPSKKALPTAPAQVLPRGTLKLPAQAHWPHWQRSRCSSGMPNVPSDFPSWLVKSQNEAMFANERTGGGAASGKKKQAKHTCGRPIRTCNELTWETLR